MLRCGDIPEVSKASYDDIEQPYLPGSVVKYECDQDYQLKQGSNNTIVCQISDSEARWANTVKCIPGKLEGKVSIATILRKLAMPPSYVDSPLVFK